MTQKISPYAFLLVIFLIGMNTSMVALPAIALFVMIAFVDRTAVWLTFLLLAITTQNMLFWAIAIVWCFFVGAGILFGPRERIVVVKDNDSHY